MAETEIINNVPWIALGIIVGIFILAGIRIIRPTHRGAIETLGKYQGFRTAGITWIIPFIQKLYTVDITEQLVDVAQQEVITDDNLNATVDAQVYFKVGDDEDSLKNALYKVHNYERQIVQLARTTLRNVIGTKPFKDVNSKRNELNTEIFGVMEKETKDWGISIVRVELKEIEPPKDVQATMNDIIKANNTKVANIDYATAKETEAKGDKLARIQRAIGYQKEQELRSMGEKVAIENVAKGKKFEIETIAKAEAEKIKLVNTSANEFFKENAQVYEQLQVTQKSLEKNTKYVITKDGINPTLVLSDSKKIIPLPKPKSFRSLDKEEDRKHSVIS